MEDPSRRMWARRLIDAMNQQGFSRNDIVALMEEEPQGQESQQRQIQQRQAQHIASSSSESSHAPTIKTSSYHDRNISFDPASQYRLSMATVSSGNSSRDSCFSAASKRSSMSSTMVNLGGHRSSVTASPMNPGATMNVGSPMSSMTVPPNPVNAAASSMSLAGEAKFWCTSCNKTFKRKFDWKRHEEEFHDRSRKYPCDSCNQSFWGPNTFKQHHKSAHGCQSCQHAEKVMRQMKKRRAYGCGFCAALHNQFERHIDHVAAHFETGMTKLDWSHSNVIYGLLHQHGIIESWKARVAAKNSQFHDSQPMFGWPAESTGRAHGFVENENPGQLQDLLEFFDGSKESAKRILELAEACVHVVLRPKSPSGMAMLPLSGSSNTSPRASRSSAREPRRSTSMSAMFSANKGDRRTVSSSHVAFETMPSHMTGVTPHPSLTLSSSSSSSQQQLAYQNYIHASSTIQTHTNAYEDKALPPPPIDAGSPMAVDFPSFDDTVPRQAHYHRGQQMPQQQNYLPEVDFMSDWQSFTSTLVGDNSQAVSMYVFPTMSWDELDGAEQTPQA